MNPTDLPVRYGANRRTKILAGMVGLSIAILFAEVFALLGMAMHATSAAKMRDLDASASIHATAPLNAFAQWQPSEVLTALQESGLDVEALPGGKKNDELVASLQVGVQRFRARVDTENVEGIILTFYSKEELARMENYYRALNRALPAFKSWVFVRDNLLLQINGNLTADQAKRFEQALDSVGY